MCDKNGHIALQKNDKSSDFFGCGNGDCEIFSHCNEQKDEIIAQKAVAKKAKADRKAQKALKKSLNKNIPTTLQGVGRNVAHNKKKFRGFNVVEPSRDFCTGTRRRLPSEEAADAVRTTWPAEFNDWEQPEQLAWVKKHCPSWIQTAWCIQKAAEKKAALAKKRRRLYSDSHNVTFKKLAAELGFEI